MDSEQLSYSLTIVMLEDKVPGRRKNGLIYNLVRRHFPDSEQTVIVFYDYSASEFYPRSPGANSGIRVQTQSYSCRTDLWRRSAKKTSRLVCTFLDHHTGTARRWLTFQQSAKM